MKNPKKQAATGSRRGTEPSPTRRKQLLVRVPSTLHKKLKIAAAAQEVSLQALVESVLEKVDVSKDLGAFTCPYCKKRIATRKRRSYKVEG